MTAISTLNVSRNLNEYDFIPTIEQQNEVTFTYLIPHFP